MRWVKAKLNSLNSTSNLKILVNHWKKSSDLCVTWRNWLPRMSRNMIRKCLPCGVTDEPIHEKFPLSKKLLSDLLCTTPRKVRRRLTLTVDMALAWGIKMVITGTSRWAWPKPSLAPLGKAKVAPERSKRLTFRESLPLHPLTSEAYQVARVGEPPLRRRQSTTAHRERVVI